MYLCLGNNDSRTIINSFTRWQQLTMKPKKESDS